MTKPVAILLALLAPCMLRREDALERLRTQLTGNDTASEQVESALGGPEGVVRTANAAALTVLVDGLDRFCDKLQESEVALARAAKRQENSNAAAKAKEAKADADRKVGAAPKDEGEKKDAAGKPPDGDKKDGVDAQKKSATDLNRLSEGALKDRHLVEVISLGLLELVDSVAKKGQAASVPTLLAAYEHESTRILSLEQREQELEGKLAKTSAKLFEAESQKAQSGETDALSEMKAEQQAGVDRVNESLTLQRNVRTRAAMAAGVLLATAKGPEVDQALKKIEKQVDGKSPAQERIPWLELYARLGREAVPAELMDVADSSARALHKQDEEDEKLKVEFDRAKEALFKQAEKNGGQVSVRSEQAYKEVERKIKDHTAKHEWMLRLKLAAAAATPPAVAALPEAKRDKGVSWLLDQAANAKDAEARCALIEALDAVDVQRVREALRKLVVDDKDVRARISGVTAVAALRDAEGLALVRGSLLAHPNWRVRAAAIAALARVPQKESIPALITALASETGRLKEDATLALQRLTGQTFAASAPTWQRWWDAAGASFHIEDVKAPRRAVVSAWDEPKSGGMTFFGIKSTSKKVCFVLDLSGSMKDPIGGRGDRRKIDVAKEELKHALDALSDDDQFMIITFSASAQRWQRTMTNATTSTREKVHRWIDEKIEAVGPTNIYEAMKDAFTIAGMGAHDYAYESAIDTIYFMSDGDATVGEVTDPLELRRLIREWNKLSRIRVHTIGVGDEPNIALLYGIAEDSGGQFVKR